MKVLHLSDAGLPDWRVEKSAISGIRNGYTVSFAGPPDWTEYTGEIFSRTFDLRWTSGARMGLPYHWNMVRKRLRFILSEANPDIIHAHNLFSAKLAAEFDVPIVYDDHEFWSMHAKLLLESSKTKQSCPKKSLKQTVRRNLLKLNRYYIGFRWARWEKAIVQHHPVITVSEAIKNQFVFFGNSNVFVVPNVPLLEEVQTIQKPLFENALSSIYAGHDGLNTEKYPYRNMDGLFSLFESNNLGTLTVVGWPGQNSTILNYKGLLKRDQMFSEMTKHSVGLVPWKKHWSHVYLSPNKAYEYANMGLLVVCTSSLKSIISSLNNNCEVFDDYSELTSVLTGLAADMELLHQRRIKIMNFARQNLVWEKFEKNIIHAYKIC